jgi:hypothetical protein
VTGVANKRALASPAAIVFGQTQQHYCPRASYSAAHHSLFQATSFSFSFKPRPPTRATWSLSQHLYSAAISHDFLFAFSLLLSFVPAIYIHKICTQNKFIYIIFYKQFMCIIFSTIIYACNFSPIIIMCIISLLKEICAHNFFSDNELYT